MEAMTQSNRSSIEKYLDLYRRDPQSKVFAPLAEAYRKNGQIEHALDIALKGIKHHPDFASGRMTLGRIYMAQNLWDKAIAELKQASELNPEILLAHKLLGECYIEKENMTAALQAYKMALYLDPLDEKAKAMVKKLESLNLSSPDGQTSASTQEPAQVLARKGQEEGSATKTQKPAPITEKTQSYEMNRYISLIDAYISRRDFSRATQTIDEALQALGSNPEFLRRKQFIDKRFQDESAAYTDLKNSNRIAKKIEKLRLLQERIEQRRIFIS